MSDDDIEKIIVDKFNELTGKNVSDYSTIESNYLGDEMYKYYEYYQFKKAKFDCDIVTYNNVSGRIDKMVFNFNGTIE